MQQARRRSKPKNPIKIEAADLESSDHNNSTTRNLLAILTGRSNGPGPYGIPVDNSKLSGSFKSSPKQSEFKTFKSPT